MLCWVLISQLCSMTTIMIVTLIIGPLGYGTRIATIPYVTIKWIAFHDVHERYNVICLITSLTRTPLPTTPCWTTASLSLSWIFPPGLCRRVCSTAWVLQASWWASMQLNRHLTVECHRCRNQRLLLPCREHSKKREIYKWLQVCFWTYWRKWAWANWVIYVASIVYYHCTWQAQW